MKPCDVSRYIFSHLRISVPPSKLRYWEECGLLEIKKSKKSGHKIYSDGDLEKIYMVTILREIKVPIRDIKDYLNDDSILAKESIIDRVRVAEGIIKDVKDKLKI